MPLSAMNVTNTEVVVTDRPITAQAKHQRLSLTKKTEKIKFFFWWNRSLSEGIVLELCEVELSRENFKEGLKLEERN